MTESSKQKLFFFVSGLYLALLQFSYYFLVEAFLSSRSIAYFIALFFWLCGFLVGLNIKNAKCLMPLAFTSLAGYYLAFGLLQLIPFHNALFPLIGILIALSSAYAGYFFVHATSFHSRTLDIFIHENNGFIIGVLISLIAADFAGRSYLTLAPLIGYSLMITSNGFRMKQE